MKNSDKYGEEHNDIIRQAFNDKYEYGVGFCKYNIKKYLERKRRIDLLPEDEKQAALAKEKGGRKDLIKAMDYMNRWAEQIITSKDLDELTDFIKSLNLHRF